MEDGDPRAQTEIAVFSLLERGLAELPITATPHQRHQLTDLILLLEDWASKINLTGHRDALSMTRALVLDAAALACALPELEAARHVADLGTGAGFPGLPLAILFPGAEFTLVDARKKRNHFQREARRRLGLANVAPVLGRSDEIETIPCNLVLAQAMAQPATALGLMAQWSSAAGILALPASDASRPPPAPAGFGAPELRTYSVPESGITRHLWIVRRAA